MTASPLTFRLLGQGISYSASPALMAAAFAALGLPHRYVLADAPAEAVPDILEALRAPDAGGANVTTPHKALVASLVDALASEAQRAGAVNTVVREGSRLVGHNTDLPATVEAIGRLCPEGVGVAVLLGAGGAASAVSLALEMAGAGEIRVARRSDGSWQRLAQLMDGADLLVNATPVGTGGGESPVPGDLLRPDLAVLDLVYRPSPTLLVSEARTAGARAEAGGGILLGQAWRSLELWLGGTAPREVMRAALRAELGGGADA